MGRVYSQQPIDGDDEADVRDRQTDGRENKNHHNEPGAGDAGRSNARQRRRQTDRQTHRVNYGARADGRTSRKLTAYSSPIDNASSVENVALGLRHRATFSTSGSSYFNVALVTVRHLYILSHRVT